MTLQNNNKKIKVLIVDDCLVQRDFFNRILDSDKGFEIVGLAENGQQGIDMALLKHPDIILIDVRMPEMNGFETTKRIMELYPVPIIVMSATLNSEELKNVFNIINSGAVAAIEKPKGGDFAGSPAKISKFIQTIKSMSEVKVIRRLSRFYVPEKHTDVEIIYPKNQQKIELVAIGASIGGPPVIKTILSKLDQSFAVPILIVQHITPGFLGGMAEWLQKESRFTVIIPDNGYKVKRGEAYLAPDGCHMGINEKGEIILSSESSENMICPSVSFLFRSVLNAYGVKAVGILLTGMGKDGAFELKAMKDKGCITFAQDEKSAVVHGMPGEAIKIKGASFVLPPDKIADHLKQIIING